MLFTPHVFSHTFTVTFFPDPGDFFGVLPEADVIDGAREEAFEREDAGSSDGAAASGSSPFTAGSERSASPSFLLAFWGLF